MISDTDIRVTRGEEKADRRMVVGIGIVDVHVFEKPLDVLVEEALDLPVIELRINK